MHRSPSCLDNLSPCQSHASKSPFQTPERLLTRLLDGLMTVYVSGHELQWLALFVAGRGSSSAVHALSALMHAVRCGLPLVGSWEATGRGACTPDAGHCRQRRIGAGMLCSEDDQYRAIAQTLQSVQIMQDAINCTNIHGTPAPHSTCYCSQRPWSP